MIISRRFLLAGLCALPFAPGSLAQSPEPYQGENRLIDAARSQIGVTTRYDPSYTALDYPMGDLPPDRGVCIDVIIRAYRDAFEFDFQKAIHEDMAESFSAYPQIWGLSRPDKNIDHRRVPNVETWLHRKGYEVTATGWQPGDLLTCRLPGNLPHIAVISDQIGSDGRYKAIHNIGRGAAEEPLIGRFPEERRFRFRPVAR